MKIKIEDFVALLDDREKVELLKALVDEFCIEVQARDKKLDLSGYTVESKDFVIKKGNLYLVL